MKVEINARSMLIRQRASGFPVANEWATLNDEFPPEGYRLIRSVVHLRSRKGGRAVNVSLAFQYTESGGEMFTLSEAYEFFERSLTAMQSRGPRIHRHLPAENRMSIEAEADASDSSPGTPRQ